MWPIAGYVCELPQLAFPVGLTALAMPAEQQATRYAVTAVAKGSSSVLGVGRSNGFVLDGNSW
jgi:hypothetical protein